jgi:hypothetical protein
MDAVFDAISKHPEWALAIASVCANVWLARQYLKSIANIIQLSQRFATVAEGSNQLFERIERYLDRLERRT